MLSVRAALLAVLIVAGCGPSCAAAQYQIQTPKVATKQEANSPLKDQKTPDREQRNSSPSVSASGSLVAASVPQTPTFETERPGEKNANNGGDEASEYWSILGHRVKITDSLLALFTFGLVGIGYWQGAKLQATIDLTRAEFISSHRPKLIVRQVTLRAAKGSGISDVPAIHYRIANLGDTPATIIEIGTALWTPKPKELLPISPRHDVRLVNVTVESGESIELTHYGKTQITEDGDALSEYFFDPFLTFAFLGYVQYTDELGRKRRTGFMRGQRMGRRSFVVIEHTDYEYQD